MGNHTYICMWGNGPNKSARRPPRVSHSHPRSRRHLGGNSTPLASGGDSVLGRFAGRCPASPTSALSTSMGGCVTVGTDDAVGGSAELTSGWTGAPVPRRSGLLSTVPTSTTLGRVASLAACESTVLTSSMIVWLSGRAPPAASGAGDTAAAFGAGEASDAVLPPACATACRAADDDTASGVGGAGAGGAGSTSLSLSSSSRSCGWGACSNFRGAMASHPGIPGSRWTKRYHPVPRSLSGESGTPSARA
mmetsp:Transcript_22851/g.60143  ORF Transcript_22851/g.60143 Transcript_22851/m.60143 type:complete len:249 (-) Transcript_22851:2195-2941(-)